jgi:transcriptional regulator
MRHNPTHAETDPAVVRRLIAENPWATLVSHTSHGIVASHYPVLLDDSTRDLTVLTHVGRPDEKVHELGTGEVLLIVAGPHGYISPSWYAPGETPVPTWNFSVAHCYGVPQLLDADENLAVLTRLVDHFEQHVDSPVALDPEFGASFSRGTVGLRLPITRFICKVKMSGNKNPESQHQVLDALRQPGRYRNPALAAEMERALMSPDRSARRTP